MENTCKEKFYSNSGNSELIRFIGGDFRNVLDVGCGAGDNAAQLKRHLPEVQIHGITLSEAEQKQAQQHMEACYCTDIEEKIPSEILSCKYDIILFSHVLEHLRSPSLILEKFAEILCPDWSMFVAVPNVLVWSTRLQFLNGQFQYTQTGQLDRTHLRFYTYYTVDELVDRAPSLRLVRKKAAGHVPLGPMRKLLSEDITNAVDRCGIRAWPNVFGHQILMEARHASEDKLVK